MNRVCVCNDSDAIGHSSVRDMQTILSSLSVHDVLLTIKKVKQKRMHYDQII
jgi:hypothetical protein